MPKAINQEEHKFIDGDTITDKEGKLFRIEGLSAPEIMHITGQGELAPGTPGGLAATEQIEGLAKKFNYNNVIQAKKVQGVQKLKLYIDENPYH